MSGSEQFCAEIEQVLGGENKRFSGEQNLVFRMVGWNRKDRQVG